MDENLPPIINPDINPIPPAIPTSPSKSPFGLLIKIVIGVVVLAVVGAGVVLATRIWDPLWNPFRPNPEKVIKETINKTTELKSLHSNISFSAAAESEKEKVSFSGKIEADTVLTTPSDFNFDGNFEFKSATQSSSNPLVPGVQIALAGNFKKIGDTQYLKINSFPLVFSAFLPPQIKTLENKWIKIDLESYKKIIEVIQSLGSSVRVVVPLDEIANKSKDFQKELGEKIKNILKDKQLYSIEKEFPDEKIEGEKAYHYKVSLKPAETAEVVAETIKTVEEEMLKAFGTGPAYPDSAEIKKKVEEAFNKIGAVSAEIWIGKKDFLPYKIFGSLTIKEPNKSKPAGNFTIALMFKNYDKPVQIDVPAPVKTLEEILISLLGGLFGKPTQLIQPNIILPAR